MKIHLDKIPYQFLCGEEVCLAMGGEFSFWAVTGCHSASRTMNSSLTDPGREWEAFLIGVIAR